MITSFPEVFDVVEVEPDVFESVPKGSGQFFGGYALGLMATAMARTVPEGQSLHSLHAYFNRAPAAEKPLRMTVDRVRDGRAFSSRSVHAAQDGRGAIELMASYHAAEGGPDWFDPRDADRLPDPGDPDLLATQPSRLSWMDPIDVRPLHPVAADLVYDRVHPYWARARESLPADPSVHQAVLAFISDFMVIANAAPPESKVASESLAVTLDHSIWFHRPPRADQWMLFETAPASVRGGRGLVRGTVRDRDGVLVASFNQEVLVRPLR